MLCLQAWSQLMKVTCAIEAELIERSRSTQLWCVSGWTPSPCEGEFTCGHWVGPPPKGSELSNCMDLTHFTNNGGLGKP